MTSQLSFWNLPADEQVAIIEQISEFVGKDLPELKSCGRFIPSNKLPAFQRGISILSAFPAMRNFCAEASSARASFDQYVNRMSSLFDLIKQSLAKDIPMRHTNGENVVILSPSKVRRGRPTSAESEIIRVEKEELRRTTAIANLLGARVVTIEKAPIVDTKAEKKVGSDKKETKKVSVAEPDLFAEQPAESVPERSAAVMPVANEDSFALKSLREWSWCLPAPLPQRIEALRDTRAEIAAESELAKHLVESGAAESEIAIHTVRAKRLNEEVRDLYADVDKRLCCYYIILTEINRYYGKLTEIYAPHGGYDVLVNDLRPYYAKFSPAEAESLRTKAAKMNADYELGYINNAERAKQLKNIENYMRRKDVRPSAARLKKMREYYDKVKKMGCGEDTLAGYEVFIKAMEDALAQKQDDSAPESESAEK